MLTDISFSLIGKKLIVQFIQETGIDKPYKKISTKVNNEKVKVRTRLQRTNNRPRPD
jgi:hypothetical protein